MFNKEKMKGFVSGFTIAIIICILQISVFAEPLGKTLEVFYNNIKLVVDGEEVSFGKDSKGNQIEPFIYNGTTYLPVRAVGEALGKRVTWDGKTNTVYIGKTNEFEADKLISEMDYFSRGSEYKWGHYPWKSYSGNSIEKISSEVKDNTGKVYDNGLLINLKGTGTGATYGLSVYQEYLLNQQYSKFSGTFILNYDYRDSEHANAKLLVYGDDKLIYESDAMTKGALPIDFDIDVTNVIKLKIEIVNDSSHDDMNYANAVQFSLVNAGFYK